MIFVNSFVVAEPSQPVRECGTVVSHGGKTPVQLTLSSVGSFDATSTNCSPGSNARMV